MKQALDTLKREICNLPEIPKISDEQYNCFTKGCVVALMTGGESSRFKEVEGANGTNKNSFKLPNNDTMIEMTIRMYRDAGIKNFVALVFHEAHTVEKLLGNGSKLGVNILYSHDPEHAVGKGGAVKNALINGSIPKDKTLIIHNPDDIILDYEGSFPRDIISGHIYGTQNGSLATVVIVKETPYSFTGMKINQGVVEQIEMYPMIPVPTHIGVTVFSPENFEYFDKLFDLDKKNDFEKILFPILAKDRKLYAVAIPNECWLAVNNLKAYKQLVDHINATSTHLSSV